jgi:hypothetical protein
MALMFFLPVLSLKNLYIDVMFVPSSKYFVCICCGFKYYITFARVGHCGMLGQCRLFLEVLGTRLIIRL